MPTNWTKRDFDKSSEGDIIKETKDLVDDISSLLHGHDPRATGASLAEALAMLIAGHHPAIREQTLEATVSLTKQRIPSIIERMIREGQCPPSWRGTTQ